MGTPMHMLQQKCHIRIIQSQLSLVIIQSNELYTYVYISCNLSIYLCHIAFVCWEVNQLH